MAAFLAATAPISGSGITTNTASVTQSTKTKESIPDMFFGVDHERPRPADSSTTSITTTSTTGSTQPPEIMDPEEIQSLHAVFFGMPREQHHTTESSVIPTMSTSTTSEAEPAETGGAEDAESIHLIYWNKGWGRLLNLVEGKATTTSTTTTTTAAAPEAQPTEIGDDQSDTTDFIPAIFHGGGHDRSPAPETSIPTWSDGIERYQSDRSKPISLLPEYYHFCFDKFNNPFATGDVFKESVHNFCSMPKQAPRNTWFEIGPSYCVPEKGRCSDYNHATCLIKTTRVIL
ncbi:hypothetical protein F5X68DRAFT_244538 [Plectosphaerella plurivora]|uniref:Uncharacterized protein n=1 Tax=Plectosphaerella plurivora TaxID=936078 RepID=A0A9P8VM97_9PEZI|nr:hypothetical protein F5X68DRAFT_244538 [Plectosphaerella plurivora]